MSLHGVLIFTETYLPVVGGGERQAEVLAGGLRARGIAVSLLTRRSDPTLPKTEQIGGVDVYRLPPAGRGQMKKWGLVWSCIPTLIRLRGKYDLVFVSGFRIVGMSAVLVAKTLGKAVVLKADSQGEMSGEFFANGLKRIGLTPASPPFRLFLALRNMILRRADACVAITDGVSAEFVNAGFRREIVHSIPNAVDTKRFFPASEEERLTLRSELGIPPDHTVVIYTGRLVSYKGLPLLLRVWKEIRAERENVRLLLVGSGSLDIHNCEDELREYVRQHGLQDSVLFTGNVDNVPDHLRASDMFVLPSDDDAFPSSLVEAMACGLPVVVTPVGAMGDIVEHEKNGLLVSPGDDVEVREALLRLLDDRSLRDRLGATAQQCVAERYGADFVSARMLEVFQSLSLSRRSDRS
jgi:glycosyltransferase involved in cell wall biosynthesis